MYAIEKLKITSAVPSLNMCLNQNLTTLEDKNPNMTLPKNFKVKFKKISETVKKEKKNYAFATCITTVNL